MKWFHAASARLRLSLGRRAAESRMHQEFALHIELETEKLIRDKGLTPEIARRRALATFGGMDQHKETLRDGRGLPWAGWVLDGKLGLRMLVKYPGLTLAGGLALTIAIGIGAAWYEISGHLFTPRLPLPDGDRIVEIEVQDATRGQPEARLLHDFTGWDRDLSTVVEVSAYRNVERKVVLAGGRTEVARLAITTSSAFRVAGVPPLLGRPLLDADERPEALDVVVLGYSLWQRWFDGDASVVGQTVYIGGWPTTVAGVMPEGFGFPVNHELWVPLRIRPAGYAPLEGPPVVVFGRLAPGATHEQASAELAQLAARAATDHPRTHAQLRPRLLAYGHEFQPDESLLESLIRHGPVTLALLIACMNVGTLIYTRTATREHEIAMRSALGASRWRIVGQLFIEALVLSLVAAIVGLAAAHWALTWGIAAFFANQTGGAPFWIDPGLSTVTMIYAAGLAVAGASLVGVLPALKATGRDLDLQLKNGAGAASTLRFGKVWTGAMVSQVALTVICLAPAVGITDEMLGDIAVRAAFPTEEYLAVRLAFDDDINSERQTEESELAFTARKQAVFDELARRVAAEPGVRSVTFGDRLPGMDYTVRRVEVEEAAGSGVFETGLWTTAVGPEYFETFDRAIVAGRDFHEGDRAAGTRTVIVNEAFARRHAGGGSPVGRRLRFVAQPDFDNVVPVREPWSEIVGVVRDFGITHTDRGEAPYVFSPVSAAVVSPVVMGVRVSGNPELLAPRVHVIASVMDPDLRLIEVAPLDRLVWRWQLPNTLMGGTFVVVVGLALFLSAAGIFSLMSVSVARHAREIGLRAALGASRARLLAGVFSRALALLGSGILIGNGILLFTIAIGPGVELVNVADQLAATSALMLIAGLLACVGPARRALRIQPAWALKDS